MDYSEQLKKDIASDSSSMKTLKEKISPQLKYYYNNRERILVKQKAYKKVYYQQHKEEMKKKLSEQYKIWQKNNPLKVLERNRRYCKKHPEKIRFFAKQRYARKMGAEGTYTSNEWEELKRKFDFACLMCDRKEPEIKLTPDHIVPLIKDGTNFITNIQPLCRSCNSKKNDKIIIFA